MADAARASSVDRLWIGTSADRAMAKIIKGPRVRAINARLGAPWSTPPLTRTRASSDRWS